jgi:hypothetical protein
VSAPPKCQNNPFILRTKKTIKTWKNIFLFRGHPIVFNKLKDNKIVSGFSQTQHYVILLYFDDDMFWSLDHHQAILENLE